MHHLNISAAFDTWFFVLLQSEHERALYDDSRDARGEYGT